jgi:hypothetical protein
VPTAINPRFSPVSVSFLYHLNPPPHYFFGLPSDYGAKIEDLKPQPHWGLARFDPAAYVDLYHSQLCWELSRPWLETMV